MWHIQATESQEWILYILADCVLFFELTIAKDARRNKYPKLDDNSRLELILNRMSKWFGQTVRTGAKELIPPCDYPGVIEYIVVSSRVVDNGDIIVGNRKKEAFSWVKFMDRNDLKSFFTDSHIDNLACIVEE